MKNLISVSVFALVAVACANNKVDKTCTVSEDGILYCTDGSMYVINQNEGGTSNGGTITTSLSTGGMTIAGSLNIGGGAGVVSTTDNVGGTSSSGGVSPIGGTSTNVTDMAGTTATGGTSSSGGSGVSPTGGTVSSGGSVAVGGTSSSGGSGVSPTGGTVSSGGSVAVGGTSSSGGSGVSPTGGTNSTGGSTGNVCYSIKLNAPDAHISSPTSQGFSIGTSDFTVELWVKVHAEFSNGQAIYHMNEQYLVNGFRVGYVVADKQYYCNTYNSSARKNPWITTPAVIDNAWHHVACVRNSTMFSIFLDGKLTATDFIEVSLSSTSPSSIGQVEGYKNEMAYSAAPVYLSSIRFSKVARYHDNFVPERFWNIDTETVSQYLVSKPYVNNVLRDETNTANNGSGSKSVLATGCYVDF